MNILWTTTLDQSQLPKLATKLLPTLQAESTFCLWLIGPLGAGKTTLTGALLRGLGLSSAEPVTSPTYTFMNEYRIGDRWFAHLDLYRAQGRVSPEDLGLADAKDFAGIFVEWPEVAMGDPYLAATHQLDIAFTGDGLARTYTLSARTGV